jgi:geranyl-CoA carboxylase alpha subunit
MVSKLLIANRGEIACRVIRTARRMGIETVAVYSDADAGALHVRSAHEAVRIGPSPASQSYLNTRAIIDAARVVGADAIHPGYGFLSENADFAQACIEVGLVLVGPSPDAIRAMGDKGRAKALMRSVGVPVVPGYDGADQSTAALEIEAERVGFPLLVKAASGGGGRGMRRVGSARDVSLALESARREAENAFGDGTLLLERLIESARHIEFQIFGDSHGNVVHLGERDCSTQRRHQKIIEEAPSPFVDANLRAAMGIAAVAAAKAVRYQGAGTVEFIVAPDRSFFFLEMNTRLQVEHPVTEMITGLDLVEWQLRVARGEALPLDQDEVLFDGHAIEARLCAEDVAEGFAPQTGKVLYWRPETLERRGARVDHGTAEGDEISPFYDSMVAKFIVHGKDRATAITKLDELLRSSPLLGVTTNRTFLRDVLAGETFQKGEMTTSTIDEMAIGKNPPDDHEFAFAAAGFACLDGDDWFSSTGARQCHVTLQCDGVKRACTVIFERGRLVAVDAGGTRHSMDSQDATKPLSVREGRMLWLDVNGVARRFEEPDPMVRRASADDGGIVTSPVSGLVREVSVREGDHVVAGQTVAMIEAMKMETPLLATRAGTVGTVRTKPGEQVRAGDVVIELALPVA